MLLRIPLDTQKEILGFLDAISLLSLARVNRHFRDLIAKQESLQAAIALKGITDFICSISEQTATVHNFDDWMTHFPFCSSEKSTTYKRAKWERIQSHFSENDSDPRRRKKTLVKIIVIGEAGVGKTTLARTYVYRGTSNWVPTIGMDFWSKEMKIRDHLVTAQIWDTAGQERFQSLGATFYRATDAVIVTYDVMRSETFQAVEGWINMVREFVPDSADLPIILCGNKLDLLNNFASQQMQQNNSSFTAKGRRRRKEVLKEFHPIRDISVPVEESQVWELAKRLHLPWIQTSAKSSTNVDLLFQFATVMAFFREQLQIQQTVDIIDVVPPNPPSNSWNICWCSCMY